MPIDDIGGLIDEVRQSIGGQGLSNILNGIQGLQGAQSTAEIPPSVAKLLTQAVGSDARLQQALLKMILENQGEADKIAGNIERDRMRNESALEREARIAGTSMDRAKLASRLSVREANAASKRKIWEIGEKARMTSEQESLRIQRLTEQAVKLQQAALTSPGPNSPTAKAALESLRSDYFKDISSEAVGLAGVAETSLNERLQDSIMKVVASEEKRYRQIGAALPSELLSEIGTRVQAAPSTLQSYLDSKFQSAATDARMNRKIESGAAKLKKARSPEPLIDEFRSAARATPQGTSSPRAVTAFDSAIEGAEVAAKGARNRKLLGGAGVLAAAAYLLPKMFSGEKEGNGIPPEMQAMMMEKLRGGSKEVDPQVGTGRELMNMSRAMSLVKMMKDMGAMQSGAAMSSMGVI